MKNTINYEEETLMESRKLDIEALSRKVQEELEAETFPKDFAKVKPYIYAYPLINYRRAPWDDDPMFMSNGFGWKFVLLNEYDNYEPYDVDFGMQLEWDVSEKELQESAVENIRKCSEYATCTLMFGKAEKHTVIPFFKVSLDSRISEAIPFGASLLLVNDVKKKLRKRIGNYSGFVEGDEAFYAIPDQSLELYDVTPDEAVGNIIKNGINSRPIFYKPDLLMKSEFNQILL